MFQSGKRKKGEEGRWGARFWVGDLMIKIRERLSDCVEKELGEE